MSDSPAKIVYRFGNGVYLNITNRCPNLCAFCIKTKWNMDFRGNNLNLAGTEPSAQEVIAALKQELPRAPFDEVVFCGYGEATMRLDVLLEVGEFLKTARETGAYAPFAVRLNTNGLGNLINRRNIVPELRRVLDRVSVSLNAENAQLWRQIVRPFAPYADGYPAVVEFLKQCAAAGFDKVAASCVENTGADPQLVKQVAEACGAEFHLRSAL